MTVWRFVLQSRVHAAARALARSDRRITQIALDFGFCDASAFSRTFRASTGVTPKQYRARATAPT